MEVKSRDLVMGAGGESEDGAEAVRPILRRLETRCWSSGSFRRFTSCGMLFAPDLKALLRFRSLSSEGDFRDCRVCCSFFQLLDRDTGSRLGILATVSWWFVYVEHDDECEDTGATS